MSMPWHFSERRIIIFSELMHVIVKGNFGLFMKCEGYLTQIN